MKSVTSRCGDGVITPSDQEGNGYEAISVCIGRSGAAVRDTA